MRLALLRLAVPCAAALLLALALPRAVAGPPTPAAGTPPYERVEVTAVGEPDAAAALLARLGAVIEVRSHDRIQALLPADRLPQLRAARAVLRVEPPARPVPLDIVAPDELIGADRWRTAGFTGRGVRVAVLDTGFDGYQQALGVSLPARVTARTFRADGVVESGTDHGTRAAEVVHRVAPGAQLYLLSFGTVTELSAAVDFVVEEGIEVVSFSLGFIHNGPGDGTGPVDEIVTRGTAGGAIWTVAAGNWARQHWAGPFMDADADSVLEFAPGVPRNGRLFRAGDLIIVSLRWNDDWGAACSDYDLELFGPSGSLVRASRDIHDCSGIPVEGMQVLATEDGRYTVRVVRASADEARDLDLMVVGSPGRGEVLDLFVEAGSLSEPADHPAVITVGAVSNEEPLTVERFSSRGPTVDGRQKPELVSPSGLVGALEGGEAFAGTSAAAPHVAGVVAHLREAFPDATVEEIRVQLAGRALPLVPAEREQAGAPAMLVNLGSLAGLGLLLPVGGEEALVAGAVPPGRGPGAARLPRAGRLPAALHALAHPRSGTTGVVSARRRGAALGLLHHRRARGGEHLRPRTERRGADRALRRARRYAAGGAGGSG